MIKQKKTLYNLIETGVGEGAVTEKGINLLVFLKLNLIILTNIQSIQMFI